MVSSADCRLRGPWIKSHKERKLKLEKEELRAGAENGGGGNFAGGGGALLEVDDLMERKEGGVI